MSNIYIYIYIYIYIIIFLKQIISSKRLLEFLLLFRLSKSGLWIRTRGGVKSRHTSNSYFKSTNYIYYFNKRILKL